MKPLRPRTLVAVGAVAAVLGWAALGVVDASGTSLPLPWTVPVVLLVLAVVVMTVGLPVRRWVRGHRVRPLDPLRAARAAVLAQAGIITGVALAGLYVGIALVFVPTISIEPRRADLLRALLAVGCALVLLVVSLLVQRWCRVPPDDPDAPTGGLGRREDEEQAADGEHSHSHTSPPGSRGHPGSR